MRVEAASRPSFVAWTILEHTSLDEWSGTKVSFALEPADEGQCILSFRHEGLTPKLDCYEDCEAGWEHFLTSLVSLAERGEGDPFRGRKRRSERRRMTHRRSSLSSPPPSPAIHASRSRRRHGERSAPTVCSLDGRIFAMLVRGALVVKLTTARVEELVASGRGKPFHASQGRVMRAWVTIEGFEQDVWLRLAREAHVFASGATRRSDAVEQPVLSKQTKPRS